MLHPAIEILDSHRQMAISTVRPDGWPQTTIVGYANEGWTIYFLIFRSSQKFINIARDDRISIAVGDEARSMGDIKAVYAGAHASEVKDEADRARTWELLTKRHPNLADFGLPEDADTALMRAKCKHASLTYPPLFFGPAAAFPVAGGGGVSSKKSGGAFSPPPARLQPRQG